MSELPHIELIRNITELWEASQDAQDRCTTWQKGFVKDQIERYYQYGDTTRFSPRQVSKLEEAFKTMQGLK